jgi:hypothetical protein
MPRFLSLLLIPLLLLFFVPEASAAKVYMAKKADGFAYVPLCDGFDYPVGRPNGDGYYKSRGLRLKSPRHLGEDWNGNGMGNSDLGDPVYTIGHGVVTYASDARGAWGNVVIVRHAFRDPKSGKVLCFQTLYGHLDKITVKLGQLVFRGAQVGTIGTNHGMYPAHLHAELHFNISVNCGQQGIPKTAQNYGNLEEFIKRFRRLTLEKRMARVPIGTFLPYKGTEGM